MALQNPRLPRATPTPSPSPSPSPSPGASPSPSPGEVAFAWERIDLTRTQTMYNNHDSFAVLIYQTNDNNVTAIRDMVENAARRENVPVYVASFVHNMRWVEMYVSNPQNSTPLLLVVRGNRSDRRNNVTWRANISTANSRTIEEEFWSFRAHLNNLRD